MSSCIFQCDLPYQWIEQRRIGPCLYRATVMGWGDMFCVCGMTLQCSNRMVKETHCYSHSMIHRRNMTSNVEATINQIKQTANKKEAVFLHNATSLWIWCLI